MLEPIDVAELYFELSNKSDLDGIEKLFTNSTIYSSQTTGEYVGVKDIMAMQRAFHGKFSSLNWKVNSAKEMKPGVIFFDYDFSGELVGGKVTKSSGLECITVKNGKLQKIEIKAKP